MSAAETGADPAAAFNLNLNPEEKRVYGQLFRQADSDNVGVVTGEVAVKFFEKTRLDSKTLGEIWQIADNENRGFLTPAGFSAVLRLIGHAQAGREPSLELAAQPGPLPHFDGFQVAGLASPQAPPTATLQPQGSGGPVRIPPLTPDKVNQYAALFERQNLRPDGLLAGDQAKQIFEKSGLPNEILGRIWQLADTEQRGALVQTEFVIAMHLLTSLKSGVLRALPNILPAPLYEAATRRGSAARPSPTNTGVMSAIPRQISGTAPIRTGSPLSQPPVTPTGPDWLITPADKARFDQLFDELDKTRKGFITGEEAVPFLAQSNLPEDALAHIWDLADFNSEGRLTRDTFAVVMYLIRQQRTKRDGTALPASLPPNLVPPSMRQQPQAPTAGSPFDTGPPGPAQPPHAAPITAPATKSALDDLFGLDASSPTIPAAQTQTAQTTGGSVGRDSFATGTKTQSLSSPPKPSSPVSTQFKPFVPSSSFGRGLTAQMTGDSAGSGAGLNKPSGPASAADDLLGDNDPEISKKLTGETTELANLSNQVGSLSKQMQEVQGQRATAQNELNQTNAQKKNFEQRLAQLRTLYEKEANDLQALQEQLNASRKETQRLQAECMQLDTTYQDLATQHQQVLANLEADKQENAKLKEKMRVVNGEITQIKAQLEKLKSEARQQKGLVAINKKQLMTNEGERDKLQMEASELAKSNAEAIPRQDTGTSIPGSTTTITSPAASVASANNPFFKRTASTDIMGAFGAPGVKPNTATQSFDDIFGPSSPIPGPVSTPPPPAVSFKPQNTGASTGSVGSFATPPTTSPSVSRQATLTSEPPAAPESRQGSSGFMPFADTTESVSSSRAVSPPASRVDESADAAATPTQLPHPGPGAFPSESALTGEAGKEAKPANESVHSTNGDASVSTASTAEKPEDSVDDPFEALDQDKAKAEFDNAFATFSKAHKAPDRPGADTNKPTSAFDTEFPPISELERDDDDSDTASERGGFDDDFAPVSPSRQQEQLPAAVNQDLTEPVPSDGTQAESGEKSDTPTSGGGTVAPPPAVSTTSQAADNFFGSTVSVPAPGSASGHGPTPATSQAQVSKSSFEDLDDEFEGLEDAKEGSADDDFQTISRSGLDDFNPVFDSSPPPSQTKGTSSTAPFGQESSYDFGTTSTVSTTAAGPGESGNTNLQKSSPPAESHDWDAIFATLDAPSESLTVSPPPSKQPEPSPPLTRGATEEGKDDDPILKDLTSMGYSRSDALLALEKYDYNLERAANHLASQS
ncbi:hypothetical protein ACRALDRAFT_2038384 [Sodiomyces alcalophilus JCM 7366]|uniref:uncharacterized protein n=1 Tax=Sodiomyces alcalophilus JCM 7366 TaxID=591952 RepID=UPI0039B51065